MYLQHFGLDQNPFSLTPDPRFLFLTAEHREALAALLFAVTQQKGFMVMTGEAGTGKTKNCFSLFRRRVPNSA
jgi:general secretion pathway protein A